MFDVENIGSSYGCSPYVFAFRAELTGHADTVFSEQVGLACHEVRRITVSSIVTAPPGMSISVSAIAGAGAANAKGAAGSDTVVASALGDVSCDVAINSIDAALVLQIEAGKAALLPCSGDADVNHDGELDALDALLILQFNAGLITEFP